MLSISFVLVASAELNMNRCKRGLTSSSPVVAMVKVFFSREIFSKSPVSIGTMVVIALDSNASITASLSSSSTSISKTRSG